MEAVSILMKPRHALCVKVVAVTQMARLFEMARGRAPDGHGNRRTDEDGPCEICGCTCWFVAIGRNGQFQFNGCRGCYDVSDCDCGARD